MLGDWGLGIGKGAGGDEGDEGDEGETQMLTPYYPLPLPITHYPLPMPFPLTFTVSSDLVKVPFARDDDQHSYCIGQYSWMTFTSKVVVCSERIAATVAFAPAMVVMMGIL